MEGELTIWVRTNETGRESLYGIWGNQPGDPYYDYLKEQFPNLKLNFVINKGWGDIAGAAAAGDAPDIFFIDGNPDLLLPQLLNQGLMEPLNEYMEKDEGFVNNFVPGVLDAMSVDGKLYALPFDVMPYGIFVNYDVLDNANVDYPDLDWTLDQFVDMCKAVTNKSDPANPRIAIARNVIENDYIRFLTMFCAVYGVKGYGINAEGKAVSNLAEDPNAIAAIEKYLEIQANDYAYTLSQDERNVAGLDADGDTRPPGQQPIAQAQRLKRIHIYRLIVPLGQKTAKAFPILKNSLGTAGQGDETDAVGHERGGIHAVALFRRCEIDFHLRHILPQQDACQEGFDPPGCPGLAKNADSPFLHVPLLFTVVDLWHGII